MTPGVQCLVIALVLGLSLAPATAEPQPAKLFRIGYLSTAGGPYHRAVQEGLRDFGWVEGQNVFSEYRGADGNVDRLPRLAVDLVRSKVDIIVAMDTAAAHAAKAASSRIPVVFATSDPAGLVENVGRPGGNVTGVTNIGTDIVGKQFEVLKEMVPSASEAGVLARADSPTTPSFVKQVEAAARSLGLRLKIFAARDPSQIDRAFRTMAREPVDILLIQADTLFFRETKQILAFTAAHRLPAIYGAREFTAAGGLISYGTNLSVLYRRIATYIDRVLRGAKPGDLPVEQPTRFELVINVKTAKALGLKIPQSLLLRADEVIE